MRFQTRILSVLVVAAISVVVMVFHGIELTVTSNATRELVDATHAPGFGLVAVGALLFFRQTKTPAIAYFFAFAFASLLAIVAEASQIVGPRDADVADFGNGLIGIGGFLMVAACLDPQMRPVLTRPQRPALLAIGVLATIVALLPLLHSAWVVSARAQALPVVAGFDATWETAIYSPLGSTGLSRVGTPQDWPVEGGKVLAVDLEPIRFSGISIDPYPDWSGFESITFLAASSDGATHRVTLRIHDSDHDWEFEDRFNTDIVIGPQAQRFEIPLADVRNAIAYRELDLSRVADITFFKVNAADGERILIDDIRLQ